MMLLSRTVQRILSCESSGGQALCNELQDYNYSVLIGIDTWSRASMCLLGLIRSLEHRCAYIRNDK